MVFKGVPVVALGSKGENAMSRKGRSIFIGAVAFLLFASIRSWIPLHNMMFFLAACVLFVGVTVLTYSISGRWQDKGDRIWQIAPVALLAGWMVLFYIFEMDCPHPLDEEPIRKTFPLPLWILLMAAGVVLCLFLLNKEKKEKSKLRRGVRIVVSLVFTAATSIQFYAPNVFLDVQGGIYHSHSYTNSIINVAWMVPYSSRMTSNYGHYGILFMPIIRGLHKLFSIDYLNGIYIVSAVITGISILIYLYVLNYFAKRDVTFYLGMFAIGEYYFMLMQGGVYLQVHPHRMLFPILITAFALWEKKRNRRNNLLAVVILTVSMIWSTEVGLVTICAFALYRWVDLAADGEALSLKKGMLLVREAVVYIVLPFTLAYIIVNGYNLAAGGAWLNFKDYMFPLISEKEYIKHIELELSDATHAWVGASILFLSAGCLAAWPVLFPKEKEKNTNSLLFLIGVMGIGVMLYYINRPVEGCMFITMFLMLILQAMILERSQDIYREWKDSRTSMFAEKNRFLFLSLRIITMLILFVMAFDCVYSMPKAYKASTETIWKREDLAEFARYVYVQVPPDAPAFGMGVPELMAIIDRDTHMHTTDWSNVTDAVLDDVREELQEPQWFFGELLSVMQLQERYPEYDENYYVHEVFEYNGRQFGFFRKKE